MQNYMLGGCSRFYLKLMPYRGWEGFSYPPHMWYLISKSHEVQIFITFFYQFFFMCSPHVSFLSNVIPKNVIWSLNSISLPNKMSFCNDPMFIFLLENIMALFFKVEILKPQSWDHISISSRADWILLSASLGDECLVQIALSIANWESDRFGTSPRASSKVFIMTLNKMGLRTLPWGQPFSRSWMSDVSFM